jgi:uncharacterized protein YdbL (DUF1318 family)
MNRSRLLFMPVLLFLITSLVTAETRTVDQVRKRMETNLPAVDELRKLGKVGETNRGYLEARVRLSTAEREPVENGRLAAKPDWRVV